MSTYNDRATPENRTILEMLVDWCALDMEVLDKLDRVFKTLEIEP